MASENGASQSNDVPANSRSFTLKPWMTPLPKENREDLGPEPGNAEPDLVAGEQIKPFENGDVGGKPYGESGSRMCQAITQAHCKRDSRTGSSDMVLRSARRK